MKFPYMVKVNGALIPANTEIDINITEKVKAEEKPVEQVVKEIIETPKALEETEIERLANEEKVKIDIPRYKTKSELTKLTTAEIKDLARRLSIADYENMSGNALKKLIWEMSQENYAED